MNIYLNLWRSLKYTVIMMRMELFYMGRLCKNPRKRQTKVYEEERNYEIYRIKIC